MATDLPGGPRQLPVTWVGAEELPVVFVNQILAQVDDRADVILSFGQVTPPATVGTPEEQAAQLDRMAYLPVKPIARFTMSRARVFELVQVLTQLLEIQARSRQLMREAGMGERL